MQSVLIGCLGLAIWCVLPPFVQAQDPTPAVPPKPLPLKVGLVPLPPLVAADGDGRWTGIAVEIWGHIARELGWSYQLIAYPTHGDLVQAIANRSIDLAIPSIPVSTLAPNDIDFSQPFFSSEYAVAVAPLKWRITWFNTIGTLLNAGILELILCLILLLSIGAVLIWLCERRKNPGEFGGTFLEGLGHGIWWSAVTMTTVGYGDKSPRTFLGRVVAFVWMFLGFILLSVFVSAIVSNITSRMHTAMDTQASLKGMQVGVITDSPAGDFLTDRQIQTSRFPDMDAMLKAFSKGQINAIFADSAHLQRIDWGPVGIRPLIISQSSGSNWYAFAFLHGDPIADPLNRAILKFIQQPKWTQITSSPTGAL